MSIVEPPWPLNERARLRALEALRMLDTPPEPVFDRLTRLAARHFDVPIALVNLIDETRQWCKARHGLDVPYVARRLSFCAYTILAPKVMVVPDTTLDDRFADNELVTGPSHLRFYAGAPLKTPDGVVVGTFCVIDIRPRPDFGEADQRDLEDFARIAMHEMEASAARRLGSEADARMHESLTLLDAVLESASDPIFAKDREGRYIVANSAASETAGRRRDEIVGRRDPDIFPPDVAARLRETDYRVMATGREVRTEEAFSGRDGTPRVFMTVKMPLRTGDGAIAGVVGMARDITDRKRAEEALRTSELHFRLLIEHTPQLMWINRPDGTIEFFNAAWRDYTGRSPTEENRWDELHPEDIPRVRDLRVAAIAAGEPYQYDMRLRRADGAWRWHLCRVVPMRDGGRIVAWIGTATDVHDIRRAQEKAEEADRSKSRFLAAASHDLRQPMQSILLFAEALRTHVPGESGRHVLDRLQQGLDTMKDLLDSLLDVSRLDAGIVAPQIEEFPVAEVIGHLSVAFAPVAAAKGIDWQTIPCTGVVRSDRVLLGRMLRNLIDNAIRYTEHGRILVDCIPQGARLRLEVRDTGIGIPTDQQSRIFEEFHQVGNPERDRDQGLGLGLAIVRRLSRLLDHPVEVTSAPGRGSVFSIAVPLVRHREPPPPPTASPIPPNAREGEAARPLAVVVEDDAIVLLGLATMLREWGYEVLTAGSTDQAMTRLETIGRRPDVVLVDYRLRQGRVGTEAVLRVRAMFGDDVPGVIITGEIGPEPQRDAAAHGLGLIQKPVTPRLLEAALVGHLGAVRPP